ncbi:MAG TPA: hypothetical protein VH280_06960 [Verrucomicrobiae bacterium]|jgi:hypothetical protein|nr:hypothetical protein [Verrucomicrobiae bacterium]
MKKSNSNGHDEIGMEEGLPPTITAERCGIVMPISAIDGCTAEHWLDVKEVLFEASETAGFDPHLVSDAEDVGIIQKRIIQNLYENPIVVCDVSGKNPNVMFELGIRLAFDKPTIIVKDDKTPYTFDTAQIEHLNYPRDLRFNRIVAFKAELAEKIRATHSRAATDPNYTTFLKHFGTFSVAKLETKVVPKDEFILEQLKQIQNSITELKARVSAKSITGDPFSPPSPSYKMTRIILEARDETTANIFAKELAATTDIIDLRMAKGGGRVEIVVDSASDEACTKVIKLAKNLGASVRYSAPWEA